MPPHLIAEEGPLKGKILSFEGKEEWTIGRDPDMADLVLEDTTVSRKHLSCRKKEDGIAILDLSQTNPILVNDQTIGEEHLLKEGDLVKIGQNIFLYSEEPLPIFDDTPLPPLQESTPLAIEEEKPHEEEAAVETSSYDTIYEPAYEEEELSIPPMHEPPLLLKVIAGPNSGAEFGMDIGREYVLGKDPESADIAFNDMSVSRRHAKISIDSDRKIFIEDLKSKNKTFVNAEEIQEKKEIFPNDLITIGTSLFLIVDKESPSETIYSESTPYERPSPKKEEESKPKAAQKEEFNWRKVIIPKSVLLFSGAFVFILFLVFLSLFSLVKPHSIILSSKDAGKDLKKIMEKYSGVEFSYNVKGQSLFLLGHVLTVIDHEELLYSLSQVSSIEHLEDNIIIDEYVWKNMNDLLSENPAWRGISIHAPTAGKFVISGFVKEASFAEDLMNYLHIHFPYTDRLENHVVVESVLNTQIATILISKGFEGIAFQMMGGELIMTGNYDVKTKDNYQAALKMLKTLEGIRSVKDLATPATATAARIDLSAKYQVTGFVAQGKENFGVVINGQIVTTGELLDGMKVTTIEPNIILLEKENLKYKINYSR